MSLTLTVTSILFGLLSGFFISELWKKYSTIRKLNSKFVSNLDTLVTNFKMLSGNDDLKEEFKQEVYNYLIVYTLLPWNQMDKGDKYFNRITSKLDDIEVKTEQDMRVYNNLLTTSSSTGSIRKELSIVGKERLFFLEWMVLISLSSIIIISSLFLRDGSIFFNFISTVLSSVVVLTLAILDDLNNLRWNAREVSFSPIQPLYNSINRREFYEKRYVEAGMAVPNSDDYKTEKDLEDERKEIYERFKENGWLASSSMLGYEV